MKKNKIRCTRKLNKQDLKKRNLENAFKTKSNLFLFKIRIITHKAVTNQR